VQFMKAGIVEVPDVIAVTKADMGAPAQRTLREARTMLGGGRGAEGWTVPVLATSATADSGIGELLAEIDRHRGWLLAEGRLPARRAERERRWLEAALRDRFGSDGLARLGVIPEHAAQSPFAQLRAMSKQLRKERS
jgi:LAO/AO transport system kinase